MGEKSIVIKDGNIIINGTYTGEEFSALIDFIDTVGLINHKEKSNPKEVITYKKSEFMNEYLTPANLLISIYGDEFVEKKPPFHVEDKGSVTSVFVKKPYSDTTFLDLKRMIDTAHSLVPLNNNVQICFPDFHENLVYDGVNLLDSYLDEFVDKHGDAKYYKNGLDNSAIFFHALPERFFYMFIKKIDKYKKSFHADTQSAKLIKDAFINFLQKKF